MTSTPTMPPVHPGEILKEEFLDPMDITPYRLAKAIGVDQTRLSQIIAGRRAITADTGLRLARFFNMSEGFWTGLQELYDRETARDALGDKLEHIHPISA
ncbi:addiction module HigA family antidote [Prauserella isguenensis]|uniref:Addiction module HigA family antidote n=1 Tax=Prauserella isguenensis TaxID=1470180 RepID=A0A839RZB8_9PSEU|nr:HigA family addiction module antitoxin [Prauserella isguenensis]MBB3049837.1 addiction module HigA family antidote [Prauserella isguenensis]